MTDSVLNSSKMRSWEGGKGEGAVVTNGVLDCSKEVVLLWRWRKGGGWLGIE
jgi:hypothetical protein